jgi:hypothetical protein
MGKSSSGWRRSATSNTIGEAFGVHRSPFAVRCSPFTVHRSPFKQTTLLLSVVGSRDRSIRKGSFSLPVDGDCKKPRTRSGRPPTRFHLVADKRPTHRVLPSQRQKKNDVLPIPGESPNRRNSKATSGKSLATRTRFSRTRCKEQRDCQSGRTPGLPGEKAPWQHRLATGPLLPAAMSSRLPPGDEAPDPHDEYRIELGTG